MDQRTVAVYEARAAEWAARRRPQFVDDAVALASRIPSGRIRADIGSGAGAHLPVLGEPVVALDAAHAMLELVGERSPQALRVRGDLEALPIRTAGLHGAWARASYLHLPPERLPLALGDLHRALAPDAPFDLVLSQGPVGWGELPSDDFTGRRFGRWETALLGDVVAGAGFEIDYLRADTDWIRLRTHRARMLPDTVGAGMRLLVAGLNPSLYTADAGVGYARPGNRFWPAALASGLVTHDRDPASAFRDHGVGMTNLVLRATPLADAISPEEYRHGGARVERLVRWLEPGALCVVGITGWRAAVDKKAQLGVQAEPFGGRPVYVMPNTSGLNAHAKPADYVHHLQSAMTLASRS